MSTLENMTFVQVHVY